MAIQAPGTYHHSLMVATLAQNAAETIGANSLMVRVCAYYHDIGKMAKPEFFSENIQNSNNPHDDLSPHMSAIVIISHVKEGLALAKRHKLPTPILDAIEQHHGNGLIHYFYNKAKEQIEKQRQQQQSSVRKYGSPIFSESNKGYADPQYHNGKAHEYHPNKFTATNRGRKKPWKNPYW